VVVSPRCNIRRFGLHCAQEAVVPGPVLLAILHIILDDGFQVVSNLCKSDCDEKNQTERENPGSAEEEF
jgi:hypothetical protein